tara:strand:- start:1566 stop:2288 length:723 start_codon:yes stop_codon:yes gene_type:complete
MFNYVDNKENYISFMDDNYLDSYGNPSNSYTAEEITTIVSAIPDEHWFTFDKMKVYVNSAVEVIGAWFYSPKRKGDNKYIGEFTDGSATIEFREKKGDPIIQWEGVLSNGKIINYESSKTLREGYGNLSTGSDFDEYDKAPVVNKWLARSWIEDGEEELFFLVESREMLDGVATHYSLPVPYDDGLKTILDSNLQIIRFKSVDLNHEGEGNFVAVVVAGVVFEDNVATKFRLYKTSRWNE